MPRRTAQTPYQRLVQNAKLDIINTLRRMQDGPVSRQRAVGWRSEIERCLVQLGHFTPADCRTLNRSSAEYYLRDRTVIVREDRAARELDRRIREDSQRRANELAAELEAATAQATQIAEAATPSLPDPVPTPDPAADVVRSYHTLTPEVFNFTTFALDPGALARISATND